MLSGATRESIDDNAVIESPTAAGEALGRDMLVTSDSAKPNQAKGKKRQKGNVVCRFYQTSGGKWNILFVMFRLGSRMNCCVASGCWVALLLVAYMVACVGRHPTITPIFSG